MNDVHPGFIALLILAPMMLAMIVQCYIAHAYTERFESHLKNCTFVNDNKRTFQHAGLLGKLMRTGLISMIVAVPRVFTRRNLIDPAEVARFPMGMKRLLVSLLIIQILLLTALVVFHHTHN